MTNPPEKQELEQLASEVFAAGNITNGEVQENEDLERRVRLAVNCGMDGDGGWAFTRNHRGALLFIAQLLEQIAALSLPKTIDWQPIHEALEEAKSDFETIASYTYEGGTTDLIRRTAVGAAKQIEFKLATTQPPDPVKTALTSEEEDTAYDIGKRDGFSDAVQQIDLKTGGDGEYRYCAGAHDPERHCPDADTMMARIVERLNAQPPVKTIVENPPDAASPPNCTYCTFCGGSGTHPEPLYSDGPCPVCSVDADATPPTSTQGDGG